ncbi:hypothetical protein [Shinella zoogloeoides]|uniref:hypothetical protein n=1 Tax=Shinella zoogloeoides TaxID=352475 RepID=UPI00299EDEFB|nr:hypothetical protein [Shinella zoogloeoides]
MPIIDRQHRLDQRMSAADPLSKRHIATSPGLRDLNATSEIVCPSSLFCTSKTCEKRWRIFCPAQLSDGIAASNDAIQHGLANAKIGGSGRMARDISLWLRLSRLPSRRFPAAAVRWAGAVIREERADVSILEIRGSFRGRPLSVSVDRYCSILFRK